MDFLKPDFNNELLSSVRGSALEANEKIVTQLKETNALLRAFIIASLNKEEREVFDKEYLRQVSPDTQ